MSRRTSLSYLRISQTKCRRHERTTFWVIYSCDCCLTVESLFKHRKKFFILTTTTPYRSYRPVFYSKGSLFSSTTMFYTKTFSLFLTSLKIRSKGNFLLRFKHSNETFNHLVLTNKCNFFILTTRKLFEKPPSKQLTHSLTFEVVKVKLQRIGTRRMNVNVRYIHLRSFLVDPLHRSNIQPKTNKTLRLKIKMVMN